METIFYIFKIDSYVACRWANLCPCNDFAACLIKRHRCKGSRIIWGQKFIGNFVCPIPSVASCPCWHYFSPSKVNKFSSSCACLLSSNLLKPQPQSPPHQFWLHSGHWTNQPLHDSHHAAIMPVTLAKALTIVVCCEWMSPVGVFIILTLSLCSLLFILPLYSIYRHCQGGIFNYYWICTWFLWERHAWLFGRRPAAGRPKSLSPKDLRQRLSHKVGPCIGQAPTHTV